MGLVTLGGLKFGERSTSWKKFLLAVKARNVRPRLDGCSTSSRAEAGATARHTTVSWVTARVQGTDRLLPLKADLVATTDPLLSPKLGLTAAIASSAIGVRAVSSAAGRAVRT